MNWHDGRFARCETLLFQLFNQMMRHKVSSNVTAHLSGTNEDVDKLIALIDDSNFEKYVGDELRLLSSGQKVSKRGRDMLHTMERACKMSGQRVEWTQTKRKGITSLIIALSQRFGCACIFGTVSPPQFNSPLALRFSLNVESRLDEVVGTGEGTAHDDHPPDTDWTLTFPDLSLQARTTLLARNPVSDARLYEKIINAFFTVLVQCSPVGTAQSTAHKIKHKKRGIFGYTRAFCGITETRKSGTVCLFFYCCLVF